MTEIFFQTKYNKVYYISRLVAFYLKPFVPNAPFIYPLSLGTSGLMKPKTQKALHIHLTAIFNLGTYFRGRLSNLKKYEKERNMY